MWLAARYAGPLKTLRVLAFYVSKGFRLHQQDPIDMIVSYGTNVTGLAGMLLKYLTGAKLVVEVPGVPEDAFQFDTPQRSKVQRLKRAISRMLFKLVTGRADALKLLYPSQGKLAPKRTKRRSFIFHDFVPTSQVENRGDEGFVLLVGHPWYTKGVDILIRAFVRIAPEFPQYRLKLMGHYPDKEVLQSLIGDSKQVEFVPPGNYKAAIDMIGRCTVFVLPSRTEAMGRVLLEAMAARKPIIASAVGGVPNYIRNGENGFVFQRENVTELEKLLKAVLSDANLRERLAERAYASARTDFSEKAYVGALESMVRGLCNSSFLVATGSSPRL
jgi:glycosyltransferase involved in cell wall biosynthesis